jgi:hypothetical protein
LKSVSDAKVARLARFLSLCYGQIMNSRDCLCQVGPDIPTDIYNDEQYKNVPNFASFVRKSKVETWYLLYCGYVDRNPFLKNVSEKFNPHTFNYIL